MGLAGRGLLCQDRQRDSNQLGSDGVLRWLARGSVPILRPPLKLTHRGPLREIRVPQQPVSPDTA